jgi:hypothetical protein
MSTVVVPHLSYFISFIAAASLIEMPPVSNVSPADQSDRLLPRPHSRRSSRGGVAEPEPTLRMPPMPRRRRSGLAHTRRRIWCAARFAGAALDPRRVGLGWRCEIARNRPLREPGRAGGRGAVAPFLTRAAAREFQRPRWRSLR